MARKLPSEEKADLLLSPPLERTLIELCGREGLVNLSGPAWENFKRRFGRPRIGQAIRSQLLANVFLHPSVKLSVTYESDLPTTSDILTFTVDRPSEAATFEDFGLLLAYCRAVDRSLTPKRIQDLLEAWSAAREKVIELWGEVPDTDGNGQPVRTRDFISSAIGGRPRPTYSDAMLSRFREYEQARDAAAVVERCHRDLAEIWSRRSDTDAIAIHPTLHNNYRTLLRQSDLESLNETDVFFLSIRSLKTLPVGRTLKETLELSATKEGTALRRRVHELSEEVAVGSSSISRVLERIEADAGEYRVLTQRLESPHLVSTGTDLALAAAGLVPIIGTVFGAASVAKSMYAEFAGMKDGEALKRLIWARYQGTGI
jgi:hypothetical protein